MIIFTNHLKTRLKQRKIPPRLITEVFNKSEENYFDNLRQRHIVISKVLLKGKARKYLLAYDKINAGVEAVTIHPVSNVQIKQKLESGRWTYENKN